MENKKKRKIINDPVYGFISITGDLIFDIIEHPYFQRLRRITQLGLTHLVYPGAMHTRFQHALGSMHLMQQVIEILRDKGTDISDQEKEGALLAILLHDIGHGPFSHALEHSIITGTNHEELSEFFIQKLNEQFHGRLDLANAIFQNTYHKKYLHQLVASQLDVDRLDYLKRDSFFSGVAEGIISSERIIKMLEVHDNELVVEAKGIYSVEKFIIARRLMYWQVYMHKTVLSAEYLLMNILRRARQLAIKGKYIFASPHLDLFLKNSFSSDDLSENPTLLNEFVKLDDYDIISAIKSWCYSDDYLLSTLCKNLINRNLYKIEIQNSPFDPVYVDQLKQKAIKRFSVKDDEINLLVFSDRVQNHAYNPFTDEIKIKDKRNKVQNIAEASDQLDSVGITNIVSKYFICYPKDI